MITKGSLLKTFVDGECVLRLFDINVATKPEDFLLHGGHYCISNRTAGAAESGLIECNQPVTGQYLTVLNLVHVDSETHGDYERCLRICEIEVFVTGKLTSQVSFC